MSQLLFFSRHTPTDAQTDALKSASGATKVVHVDYLDFEAPDDGVSLIRDALPTYCGCGADLLHSQDCSTPTGDDCDDRPLTGTIAGVFPLQTIAALRAAGFTTLSTVTTVRGLRVDQALPDQLRVVAL
jgi:hypothetical protein